MKLVNHSQMVNQTGPIISVLAIWHVALSLGGLGGAFWALTNPSLAPLLRWGLGAVGVLTTVVSGLAALFTLRRQHRGRMLSLTVNYLGFLACLFGSMHVLGMFLGIDSLADTFGRGIPFLGGVVAGYLISSFGDRYDNYPSRQRLFQMTGKWIMAVFGVIFLYAVGVVPGTVAVLGRFSNPLAVILVVGMLVFGTMIWAMWRKPTAMLMGANNAHEEMLSGYLFLSPNLLGFLLFFAGPLLFSLYVSFTNFDATTGVRDWIGLQNYGDLLNLTIQPLDSPTQAVTEALDVKVYDELARFSLFGRHYILGAEDKLFWLALRNTIMFCLMAVPLSVIPALFLANLLNSKLPGMKFFRAVYFLPSVAAVVGVALIWQWLYNAAVGYINYGITGAVDLINSIFRSAVVDPQIRWLSDTRTALLAVVIMSAWQWIGIYTVLFLAGLQNIPNELYEAATVDGAGKWAKFWNVTLPLLAPTTFFVVTTSIISALQLFEQVYVLIPTEPPGGPNNATLSLVLYLYQKGFQRFSQGYASAVAWFLFIVIFSVTLLQYWRQRQRDR
jgi:ABC-type sugar transport system permease subunit